MAESQKSSSKTSTSSQSETESRENLTPTEGKTDRETQSNQSDPETVQEQQVKLSEEVAEGKSKGEQAESYNPYTDPVVPSSTLAEKVEAELKGGGESPTLKALNDARKAAEEKK